MANDRGKILRFTFCTIAYIGLLWLFSIEVWNYLHVVLFVLCVSVWVGYLRHLSNRK